MGMCVVEHTCVRTPVLAGQEGPPSLAVKPGTIHRMGGVVRCQVHALTGPASARRPTMKTARVDHRADETEITGDQCEIIRDRNSV